MCAHLPLRTKTKRVVDIEPAGRAIVFEHNREVLTDFKRLGVSRGKKSPVYAMIVDERSRKPLKSLLKRKQLSSTIMGAVLNWDVAAVGAQWNVGNSCC